MTGDSAGALLLKGLFDVMMFEFAALLAICLHMLRSRLIDRIIMRVGENALSKSSFVIHFIPGCIVRKSGTNPLVTPKFRRWKVSPLGMAAKKPKVGFFS
jgi:hypothetical protein